MILFYLTGKEIDLSMKLGGKMYGKYCTHGRGSALPSRQAGRGSCRQRTGRGLSSRQPGSPGNGEAKLM